jgi:endonuclease/exonuclease/phosphatase family metal-dependent hydrolase/uncharacterized protein (UPF0248 family)
MRTSEEIYHRVRWDPRFDPARFVIGVGQRGAEPKRVPLPAFVPGGDIPWHRVLFVEADGVVVWDRASGVDHIDALAAGRVIGPRLLRPPFFAARTPHVWDPADGWRPARAVPREPAARRLRVLTWNTLWDRYNRDRIHTARRRPLLLEALAEADADVIALQEVEPGLLEPLLRARWVRDAYTLGTDPRGRDIPDTGLLLLSRLPVREAALHTLGPHKAITAITVETASGPLVVAATHLTSDHSTNAAAKRQAELARLAEGLAAVDGDVILLGDFNDGSSGPDGPAAALGLRDAWTEARGPRDDTPTFDPRNNPLAAVSSLSGRPARLDRILLRAPDAGVIRTRLVGDTPGLGNLFVSDHYGVLADLTLDGRRPPMHATGIPSEGETAQFPDDQAEGAAEPGLPGEKTRALAVVERVAAALGGGVAVHLAGSRRMGCALPGADLDLVAVLPDDEVDLAEVRRRVAAGMPDAVRARPVVGARVPGVRFSVAGFDVDLMLGSAAPGEAADLAWSAVADAEALIEAAGEEHAAFAGLARTVKAWARARGLDAAPFGGLPGVAWALLAVLVVREERGVPADELPRRFFGTWAAWDWREPIALTPPPAAAPPAPVTIMTPGEPVRNCAEQVGAGGRDLLTLELYQAWETLEEAAGTGRDAVPELLTPPPLHRRHAAWAVVSVRPERAAEFDELMGRVRGRFRALLTALADAGATDAHAWPRPFESGPSHATYAIGLGHTPPDPALLAEIAAHWTRGLSGVRLEWAENGQVPTLR